MVEPISEGKDPYLIAGLGNPGREYKDTRHNVGFMVLNQLAARLGETFTRLESKALVTKHVYQGRRLILAKPQTYMNDSGQAVGGLVRFYKVPLTNLMVIYDEVDLPLGILRIRPGGGSAGHKGVQSIITRLGAEDFPRLRVGIGRPPGKKEAADYVLQAFDRSELAILPQVLDQAVEAILMFTLDGLEKAMNLYNGQVEE